MRRSIYTLITATVLTFLVAATSSACGGPGKMFKALDLTPDQKEQVQVLFEAKRENKKQMKHKRKALKEKSKALATNYSEDQANQIAAEAGELAQAGMLQRLQHQHKVLQILDEKQKQKFLKIMDKKASKSGHGHGRHFDAD